MTLGRFDARIDRAQRLASVYEFASQGLRFYEQVTRFQKAHYQQLQSQPGVNPRTCGLAAPRDELNVTALSPQFGLFLSVIEQHAPAPLSADASRLHSTSGDRWKEMLALFWRKGPDSSAKLSLAEVLISWMFLRTYAEFLADHQVRAPVSGTPPCCPICGGKPLAGVLRPEGDGGKRSLICALCATEWNFRRIVCPACGEEDVHKLAVYTAAEFGHVRVEACDTCRAYIKTVDLTKDGRAVPEVDELATIPLNLWATEHGYAKLQINILGI